MSKEQVFDGWRYRLREVNNETDYGYAETDTYLGSPANSYLIQLTRRHCGIQQCTVFDFVLQSLQDPKWRATRQVHNLDNHSLGFVLDTLNSLDSFKASQVNGTVTNQIVDTKTNQVIGAEPTFITQHKRKLGRQITDKLKTLVNSLEGTDKNVLVKDGIKNIESSTDSGVSQSTVSNDEK